MHTKRQALENKHDHNNKKSFKKYISFIHTRLIQDGSPGVHTRNTTSISGLHVYWLFCIKNSVFNNSRRTIKLISKGSKLVLWEVITLTLI